MKKCIFIIIALFSYTSNAQGTIKASASITASASIIYGISITKEANRFRVSGNPNLAYSATLSEGKKIKKSTRSLSDRGLGFIKYNRDKKTELIINLN